MKPIYLLASAALAFSATVSSQEYPTRTVRIIVPLTPGSGADIAGRIVAQRMSEAFKQPVIVENRPGAGTLIGTSAVAKAEPDGYTLLVNSSSHSANPAMYKSLPYDPQKDFVDVAILGKTPYVMVSGANGPYKTLRALIEAAKAKPGDVPYASAGIGTSTHLAAEYAIDLAGVKMLHIPFKGSAEAMQDVVAGRTAFYMAPINAGINLVKDGRLVPLGVSTKTRAEILPDVPTLAEQGLKDYEVTLWFGMWAPANTPAAVVQRLNSAVNAIVGEPAVREQFGKLGLQAAPMKPDEFGRFVREEISVYRRIVQQAKVPQQ
jgi:tripartite-type tricarboxylate transporter receptor subunit TctC